MRKGHGRWWEGILDELRKHQKRWALVLLTDTPKRAMSRRQAARKVLHPLGFEVTSRPMADGKGGVYARYLGTSE